MAQPKQQPANDNTSIEDPKIATIDLSGLAVSGTDSGDCPDGTRWDERTMTCVSDGPATDAQ